MEPRLRLARESIAQSASVLRQLSLAGVALIVGLRLYSAVAHGWREGLIAVFELIMFVLIFDRLVPLILFSRTRGLWTVRIRFVLQALFYVILPVTLLLGLLLSIVALAEPEDRAEVEHPSEAMDALLEAGEEEGILEESDRELVRSVVEFGDKVVREVMTPRPEIFAVPETLTLQQFTAEIAQNVFSRVPVFAGTMDHITGIAFAHDLLQVTDEAAITRTIASMLRPAAFVPETKMVAELLREMQIEKQHMRIVIDEYGGVAGIVTIEDLLEAIVGNISDEHDVTKADDAPVREASGAYIVSGAFELSRLRDLFADQLPSDEANGDSNADDATDPDRARGGRAAPAGKCGIDNDWGTGERTCRTHSATGRGGGRGWPAAGSASQYRSAHRLDPRLTGTRSGRLTSAFRPGLYRGLPLQAGWQHDANPALRP